MRFDISLEEGSPDLPACIFIHGLGMDKSIWTDPENTRLLGGLYPLARIVYGVDDFRTSYHDMRERGHTVAAWSQSRPVGPAKVAVAELHDVYRQVAAKSRRGVILIGHSRGGLIARALLNQAPFECFLREAHGLITIGSPHRGSDMARWAMYLKPLGSAIRPFLRDDTKGKISRALGRMIGVVESRAVAELLPGSAFLCSLPAGLPAWVRGVSFGGTDPRLLRINNAFSFPESITRHFHGNILPEEMQEGKGDGLVTALSAVMPGGAGHMDYRLNHVQLVMNTDVRNEIADLIKNEFQ